MLDQLKDILGLLFTGGIIVYIAVRYWAFLGGRRALRNPWVLGPAVIGVLGLVATFFESWHTDQVHAGLAAARPGNLKTIIMMVGMCSATIGLGWAALARVRKTHRFAKLLRIPEAALDAELSWDDADRLREVAESAATRADMEHLLPLLDRIGPPEGLDWLTPEWIHQRMASPSIRSSSPSESSPVPDA